jgi:signal transduction histidine kinase
MVQAIGHLADLARQNASSTEEVQKAVSGQASVMEKLSSSALELSNISLELEEVVSRFRLARDLQDTVTAGVVGPAPRSSTLPTPL